MDIEAILTKKLFGHKDRIKHVKGVCERAFELQKRYGGNQEVLKKAALLHDICKYDSIEEQIKLIDDEALIERYKEAKVVYHALAAKAYLEKIEDEHNSLVLEAVANHMWGKIDMTLETMIIVVSDFCEPNRQFEDAVIVHQLALKNLRKAYIKSLELTIAHLLRQGITPHIEQQQCLAYYKEKK
ncbi:MAG: HD domain-containing protein [Acholeplasma sp.]|nr:HD domain-containing protein [Acholeplasma sp.]